MEKKKLRAIPYQPPGPEIKQLANELRSKDACTRNILRARMYGDIMLIDSYAVDDPTYDMLHEHRLFFEHGHFDDYIVLNLRLDKPATWRIGTLYSMNIDKNWRDNQRTFLADEESRATIKAYLKAYSSIEVPAEADDIKLLKSLNEYQGKIAEERIRRGNKKLTDIIDEELKDIPEEPDNFKQWIEEELLINSRYIYYDYRRGAAQQKGRCTWCKAEVVSEYMRHNCSGICPSCGSRITYKATGKTAEKTDIEFAVLMQKCGAGLVLRNYIVTKKYGKGARDQKLTIHERRRRIYDNLNTGHFKDYYYGDFKNSGVIRWCDGDSMVESYRQVIYPYNLQNVLKDTPYQYSAIEIYSQKSRDKYFPVRQYLTIYRETQALEYLVKFGLYRLVNDIIEHHWELRTLLVPGNKPFEALGLAKVDIKRAASLNIDIDELKVLQASNKHNVPITDEEMYTIVDKFFYYRESIFQMAKLSTMHQLLKYLKTVDKNIGKYVDYIKMAEVLNWDLTDKFILFPRDISKAHDTALKLYKPKKNHLEDMAIKKASKSLSERFGYQDEQYLIKPPKNIRELIREGHKLHHCVGSYSERIASGKTVVMFIRPKQDPYTPYFTVELDPERLRIVQVHGKDNCYPDEELNKFLDTYKAVVLKSNQQIAV